MTADRSAVLGVIVILILAAIDQNAPEIAEPEGIETVAVLVRHIARETFGTFAAQVVIPARDDDGDLSARDRFGDPVIEHKVLGNAAMVENIAVEDQKVDFSVGLFKLLHRSHRFLEHSVRVRDHIGADGIALDRVKGKSCAPFFSHVWKIGLPLDHFPPTNGIFPRRVQNGRGNADAVQVGIRAQNTVAVVKIGILAHAYP